MTPAELQQTEPWKILDEGNLIVYHVGPGRFIGHHVLLDEWIRRPLESVSNVERWYDCLEAGRRKRAAGLCEHSSHDERRDPADVQFQRHWLRRP